MKYKSISIFSICLIVSFLFIYLIVAVNVAPQTNSVNESINSLYNITISDMNITQVNITLPANFTFISGSNGTNASNKVLVNFTNISGGILIWTNSTTSYYLLNGSNSTTFWFNATASYPGRYNFTISVMNATSTYTNHTINITVNDTTAPIATFGTDPVDKKNSSSQTVVFTLGCTDGYSVNDAVFWGNFSGTWAINSTNSSMSNGTNWNVSLNIADGRYVWGIYCNDSANNTDWTNTNRTLTIDTTNPTALASCTSATLHAGDALTCSCAGTDSLSGINTTTASSVIDTSSLTGSYTYTCDVSDFAGNTASSGFTYVVSGSNSDSSSSTSSLSYWTTTYSAPSNDLTNGYTKELSEKQRVKVTVNSQTHYVGIIDVTDSTATINITSNPQQVVMAIGDERKIEVTGDNYYDLLIRLISIEGQKANIVIQSVNDLIIEENQNQENTDNLNNNEASSETTSKKSNLWWIIIIALVIALIVGFVLSRKKR